MAKYRYKVRKDEVGSREIIWWNTNIDKPTLADLVSAAQEEFPNILQKKLLISAGIMSLSLKKRHSTHVKRK